MPLSKISIGIIGGSGMLGRSIVLGLLGQKAIKPQQLWISNRSGIVTVEGLPKEIHATKDNQELVDHCDVVILSVPPAQARELKIDASHRLVISVMAAITKAKLHELSGSLRVVRAMSSPAAEHSLAYSPWVASAKVDAQDRAYVSAIFKACGKTDEMIDESHIDHFTAMTGPVPGFVAYFADCMVNYAQQQGIPAPIADRAIGQLFLGAGHVMSADPATPADHVEGMIDYAGTTAAGLLAMQSSSIADDVAKGLYASFDAARKDDLFSEPSV